MEKRISLAELSQNKHVVLFGPPGVGKNYLGETLAREHGFKFYDTDEDLPADCIEACMKNLPFTRQMRDNWYDIVLSQTSRLLVAHPKLVVANPFNRDSYRRTYHESFPEAKFALVKVSEQTRMQRVADRAAQNPEHPCTIDYAESCGRDFEKITIPYNVIFNG